MLRLGIVGKKRFQVYYNAICGIESLQFAGVFDPSFQFESPKQLGEEFVFYSFSDLLESCQGIVFTSAEKIYLPLIELALKYAKPVFLHGVHNLSLCEQKDILKLQDESREVVQVQQSILFNNEYVKNFSSKVTPLLWQFSCSGSNISNLLLQTRTMIAATLPNIKSNIRKTTVNLISSCSEVPDIYKVRIDFDNGSIADITASKVEPDNEMLIKCYEYNNFIKANLITSDNSMFLSSEPFKNTLELQLKNFYKNICSFKSPINSIENEINTQQVIEQVKQKLRININIF